MLSLFRQCHCAHPARWVTGSSVHASWNWPIRRVHPGNHRQHCNYSRSTRWQYYQICNHNRWFQPHACSESCGSQRSSVEKGGVGEGELLGRENWQREVVNLIRSVMSLIHPYTPNQMSAAWLWFLSSEDWSNFPQSALNIIRRKLLQQCNHQRPLRRHLKWRSVRYIIATSLMEVWVKTTSFRRAAGLLDHFPFQAHFNFITCSWCWLTNVLLIHRMGQAGIFLLYRGLFQLSSLQNSPATCTLKTEWLPQ